MGQIEWLVLAVFISFMVSGYYANRAVERLRSEIHDLHQDIDEICAWIQEIDPRFDEERGLLEDLEFGEGLPSSGPDLMDLQRRKRAAGERTLIDPLRREWRRGRGRSG